MGALLRTFYSSAFCYPDVLQRPLGISDFFLPFLTLGSALGPADVSWDWLLGVDGVHEELSLLLAFVFKLSGILSNQTKQYLEEKNPHKVS